jgi:hypothetical protein
MQTADELRSLDLSSFNFLMAKEQSKHGPDSREQN